jgi:phosphoenolpyruvate carboxykinase (GTP)
MSPTPLEEWVDTAAALTQPAKVVWCDGSALESESISAGMIRDGSLLHLDPNSYPDCNLYRSNPGDVARTEHLTFICTEDKDDAGPTNNWMAPAIAKTNVGALFRGVMKGRTMYVLPYLMGAPASPYSKVGVEVTDSPYVAISMRIMTRMGSVALKQLGGSGDFAPGLHSVGDLSPNRRYILHFPEEQLVWSIGSGYGGNALLGKKCLSLRLASWMARQEGWLAEHMLILGLEDPSGNITYMAAAFPSACGKTNLAMLVSPLAAQGYRVWTVGDDIAWMRVGADGRLWASNPENGFFGVVPGTSCHTNPT